MHDHNPSHSTPSPSFGGLDDGTGTSTVTVNPATLLDQGQQQLLLSHRTVLTHAMKQKNDPKTILAQYQSRIVGRPHFGTWDSLFPMIDGLYRIGQPTEPCIVLGGWLRPPPTDLSGALPPPLDLQQAARLRGIYWEARRLYWQAVPPSWIIQPAPWKQLQHWIGEHESDFAGARGTDGRLTPDSIHSFLANNTTPLHPLILDGLMFMGNQALAFFATPDDPGQAWRDCWEFCLGYDSMGDVIHNRYGPYYLLIVSPDALSALRKAAAAAASPLTPASAPATTTPAPLPPLATMSSTPTPPQYPADDQPL